MNFFRSEEHAKNWRGFAPGSEEGLLSLEDLLKMFSGPYFRRRLDPDWVSHSREYARAMGATIQEIGKTGPFWRPKKPA
ncbi:MAG: hypothetical protein AB1814_11960 [Thermodesulfobacteriota bacterium]